ncbi:MAG: xanthine dehydrogenase family protein subunit M [Candidatus Velthaea sp.]
MQPFEFVAVTTAADARELHGGRADARFLAGGTTLVDLMKAGVERPRLVVDINGLPLARVNADAGRVRIGALARNSDVAYDETVAREFPAVAQALLSGASGQLRNMATVGGNLLQRTRCPYFREPQYRCNKRAPGTGCDALEGFNRLHAVLGGSDACIATHPSDFAVALVAVDAGVVVETAAGERSIPVVDFYRLPGDRPDIETALEHGDLVVGVDLPRAALYGRSAYVKLRDRASYEFALASAAVALDISGGVIRAARVALGGVATVPWRARGAEAALEGSAPGADAFARAADAAVDGAVARTHNAFKIELARRAVVRALATAAEAA